MFNVLLDRLPTEYEGYPIDTDFGIGIQIMQVLEDEELSRNEQIVMALSLLFGDNKENMPDIETMVNGLMWFLFGWNHDNNVKKGDSEKVTDWDVDQWRIYSAFRQYYRINLQTDNLHFWEFMALLTTLPDDCAYARVADIRGKKLTKNMSKEEKEAYRRLKEVYALKQDKTVEYTNEQKQAIDDFDRMMEEQKRIRESKKLAQKAFDDML